LVTLQIDFLTIYIAVRHFCAHVMSTVYVKSWLWPIAPAARPSSRHDSATKNCCPNYWKRKI